MNRQQSQRWDIALYLAITFAITWSVAVMAIGIPDWFKATFGPLSESSPLFYAAVWGPNVASILLTITRGERGALAALMGALLRWRVPLLWWLVAILFYPALVLLTQLINLALHQPVAPLSAWALVLPAVFSPPALLLGPLGEELGWRGYLLPRVLERASPAAASLIVGFIWMVWHIPAFFVSGLPQSGMSFGVFFFGGIALSVFMTWIYVHARGSILLSGVVFHTIVNACGALGAMTPVQGGVLVLAALLVIFITGRDLGRHSASA
jgi:membrane protease YdiL (CAAX protease family)